MKKHYDVEKLSNYFLSTIFLLFVLPFNSGYVTAHNCADDESYGGTTEEGENTITKHLTLF